jgi:hypothetical protein
MGELKGLKELFAGRHFDREIIVLCVRWYLRYKFSLRDLVEMMAERGLDIAHTTIMRWVQRYVPEFEKRWNGYARKSGRSWRVDETYPPLEREPKAERKGRSAAEVCTSEARKRRENAPLLAQSRSLLSRVRISFGAWISRGTSPLATASAAIRSPSRIEGPG